MTPENQTLHSYLTRLRCPKDGRPDTGEVTWESEGDLFGASHRIELSWDPLHINVQRKTALPGQSEAQEAWLLSISRPNTQEGTRWSMGEARGTLLTPQPGETMTIALAIKAINAQVVGLGQGARPGWEAPVRRTPRP